MQILHHHIPAAEVADHGEVRERDLRLHGESELLLHDGDVRALDVANKVGIDADAVGCEHIVEVQIEGASVAGLQVRLDAVERKATLPPRIRYWSI